MYTKQSKLPIMILAAFFVGVCLFLASASRGGKRSSLGKMENQPRLP